MTAYGYHASHEQISPRQLLADVRRAEEVGFTAAMCSDHIEPWSERQGHSGMAWPWLGAALASTNLTFGTVTAPGQRYHPAIVAHAIATLGQMFPGRFWTALGSGEYANEHVTGEAWPDKDTRQRRLEECVEVITRMLAGETVTHDGLVKVHEGKLWDLPDPAPKLVAPAVSIPTAVRGAAWADGLATINADTDLLRRMLDAWDEAGGADHKILQVHLSWAPSEDEAMAIAREQWRSNVFGAPACWDLTRASLDVVSKEGITDEQIHRSVLVSSDLGLLTQRLHDLAGLGFDSVYLHHVGQDQGPFLEAFGAHVLPQLS